MISLDITKSFDDPGRAAPFHLGIHLEMPEDSRTLVLFGASGSGKTLTLHCLAGLVRPDAGRIVVDGNVLYDGGQGICVPARRRRIGYMFQDYALFPHLSVLHNVAYAGTGLLPWRLTREQRAWAMDLLERLGIAHLARLYPGNLSGGQKQRVAIAGVLAMKPDCIVLDEPTAMLDPKGRKEVMDTIHELNKTEGITIVLITHFMEEAVTADHILVIDRGVLKMEGTPREIFSQANKVTEIGLDVPVPADLARRLRKKGMAVSEKCMTDEELGEALCPFVSKM